MARVPEFLLNECCFVIPHPDVGRQRSVRDIEVQGNVVKLVVLSLTMKVPALIFI